MQQSKLSSQLQSQAWIKANIKKGPKSQDPAKRPGALRTEHVNTPTRIAPCCPGALKILNLTWCPALTDVSMLAVAKHCTRCLAAQLDSAR